MRDYWIDLTAYEHVRTIKVEAESPEEAIRKACGGSRWEHDHDKLLGAVPASAAIPPVTA